MGVVVSFVSARLARASSRQQKGKMDASICFDPIASKTRCPDIKAISHDTRDTLDAGSDVNKKE